PICEWCYTAPSPDFDFCFRKGKSVDHQEAIDIHAAEGYLLGDLTAAEHDAFEEHYADCDACFANVRDGAAVVAVTSVLPKPVRRDHWKFVPQIAAAACFAITIPMIGYQQLQLAKA